MDALRLPPNVRFSGAQISLRITKVESSKQNKWNAKHFSIHMDWNLNRLYSTTTKHQLFYPSIRLYWICYGVCLIYLDFRWLMAFGLTSLSLNTSGTKSRSSDRFCSPRYQSDCFLFALLRLVLSPLVESCLNLKRGSWLIRLSHLVDWVINPPGTLIATKATW